MSHEDDIVRASEIGQYAYCARAWWLGRVKGHRSANVPQMEQGRARHRSHGRSVQQFRLLRRVALLLITLAGLALVAWLLLNLGR